MISRIFTAVLQWGSWTAYKCLFICFHSQNWDFRTYLRCWKTEDGQKIASKKKKNQPICFGLFMVHVDTRKVWLEQPGVENGWGSTDIKTIQGVWKPELTWICVSEGQDDPSPAHSHKILTGPEECRKDKSCGNHNPQIWHISHLYQPCLLPEMEWGGGGGKQKKV